MNRRRLLALAAAALGLPPVVRRATAQEVTPVDFAMLARRRTLEAARRLAAEGWRIRDQTLVQHLEPRQIVTCPVHLICGVQYLFVATVRPIECRLRARLLTDRGDVLASALPDDETRLQAVWHTPPATTRAHLEFIVPWDASAGDLAALYVYR